MTAPHESVVVLSRALDQAGDVLADVRADQLSQPTTCGEWDVARSTGQSRQLLPEVAERGLAFMSAMLTPENRGAVFAPEVPVPDDAPGLRPVGCVRGQGTRAGVARLLRQSEAPAPGAWYP